MTSVSEMLAGNVGATCKKLTPHAGPCRMPLVRSHAHIGAMKHAHLWNTPLCMLQRHCPVECTKPASGADRFGRHVAKPLKTLNPHGRPSIERTPG